MSKLGYALALLGAVGLAACGGSHRPTPTSPTPPQTDNGGNTGGGPPPPPPPPPTLGVTRILAFGDSLTEGVVQPQATSFTIDAGLPVSYPYKLQTLETLRYSTQTITVLNAGHAGNKARDDLERLNQYLSDTHPDVVLLMEGTNDLGDLIGLSGGKVQAGITTVVNSMEDMVRSTKDRGIVPFVATLPPQRAGASHGGGAAFIDPYNNALKGMAAKKGAVLVDLNAQFPLSLIGQDGLHPTEDGYQKMAEIFQAALAAAYETPAPLTR